MGSNVLEKQSHFTFFLYFDDTNDYHSNYLFLYRLFNVQPIKTITNIRPELNPQNNTRPSLKMSLIKLMYPKSKSFKMLMLIQTQNDTNATHHLPFVQVQEAQCEVLKRKR